MTSTLAMQVNTRSRLSIKTFWPNSKELKKKNPAELNKLLNEYRDKLRDLRFKDANKQLKNIREIRVVRRLISRVLALLNNNASNK